MPGVVILSAVFCVIYSLLEHSSPCKSLKSSKQPTNIPITSIFYPCNKLYMQDALHR